MTSALSRAPAAVRPGSGALLKQAGRGERGSLAKAAERFLRRQFELEESSPFHDAPAARAEHAARMNEAQVALRPAARPARAIGSCARR